MSAHFTFAADTWAQMLTIAARAGCDARTMEMHRRWLELRLQGGLALKATGWRSTAEVNAGKERWREIERLSGALHAEMLALDEGDYVFRGAKNREAVEPADMGKMRDAVLAINFGAADILMTKLRERGDNKAARDFIVRQFKLCWRDRLRLKIGTGPFVEEALTATSSGGNHAIAFAFVGCRDLLPPAERTAGCVRGVFDKPDEDAKNDH